jgi:hypothetical protein
VFRKLVGFPVKKLDFKMDDGALSPNKSEQPLVTQEFLERKGYCEQVKYLFWQQCKNANLVSCNAKSDETFIKCMINKAK